MVNTKERVTVPGFVKDLPKIDFYDLENTPIHEIDFDGNSIRFLMLGKYTEFRIRTLFTKEPETLSVIEGLDSEDCFWDIGANIGIYTLLAASKCKHVVAVEPSPANFYVLMRNIELNLGMNITGSFLNCVGNP